MTHRRPVEPPRKARTVLSPDSRPLRVAIVDDDSVKLRTIRGLLTRDPRWQVETFPFASPVDALLEIPRLELDAILLDDDLHLLSGLEFLRKLHGRHVEVPVIGLMGRGGEAAALALLKAGAVDTVSKAKLTTHTLQRTIFSAIEKFALHEEVRRYREGLEAENEELSHQKQEIESFYHTLSHELKTPLTSMREFICIVAEGIAGPITPEQAEYLDICKRGCDQLKRIVNDLLDLSRLETGKLGIEKTAVSVDDLVEELVRLESARAEDHNITLTFETCGGELLADLGRTRQVLGNLIDNALKFTPRGGEVSVRAEESHDGMSITFTVEDNGPGIAPAEQEQIFGRHRQAMASDGSIQEGMGLGLSLCKELGELQGGRIWLRSEHGVGSQFSFTLPTVTEEEKEREATCF